MWFTVYTHETSLVPLGAPWVKNYIPVFFNLMIFRKALCVRLQTDDDDDDFL